MQSAITTPPITPEKRLMKEEVEFKSTSQDGVGKVGKRENYKQDNNGLELNVDDATSSNNRTDSNTGEASRSNGDRARAMQQLNSTSFSNSFPTPSSSNSFPVPSSASSSRQANRLASLPYNTQQSSRLTSPPQASTSVFTSNHSPNLASSTSRNASQFLLTVIPPGHLPHDPPHPRTSPFCSGYSTPDKFTRGTLIPLYPTLSSQLSAIAREYGLPSTGGLVLYLLSTSDPNASNGFAGEGGPRIGEEAWKMLWGRLFEEAEEEEIITLAETESFSDEDYDDARQVPPMPPIPSSHLNNNYRNGYLQSDGETEVDIETDDPLDSKGKSSSSRRASSSSAKFSQGRGFPPGLPSPISRSTSAAANSNPNSRRAFSSFSTASQPILRSTTSRQSFSSNQSSRSKAFPHPTNRSPSVSNFSSKPLGGLGYGSSIIVGKVEFDIDMRRGGRSKWYENWVEGAQDLNHTSNLPGSNVSSAIPSPSFQDFQHSSYGRDDVSSMSDRSPQSSHTSPIIIAPSPVLSVRELVPVPVEEPVSAVEILEEPVKELRELSLKDSATVVSRPSSMIVQSREISTIPVVEEGAEWKAIGVRGRRGAPEMRIRTASGTSQAVELGSYSDLGHEPEDSHHNSDSASRESSESPSPLPPGGSPRLSNIQLSPSNIPDHEDTNPYTALADSEDEKEASMEESLNQYIPLPDQSDRDLDEDSESDAATVDEPTLTIPASMEHESIDDVFPSDEATWRSLANEPNHQSPAHEDVEAGMIETTGLGIMGAKVEEMVATSPVGVVENLNKEETNDEAGLPPPQDDIADVKSLLQVRVSAPEPFLAIQIAPLPPQSSISGPLDTVFDAPADNATYLAEAAARRTIETDSRFSGSRTSSDGNDTPSPSTGHNASHRQGGSQWVRPDDLDTSDQSTTDHSTLDSDSHHPARYSASISEDLEEEGRNIVGDLPNHIPNHMAEDRLTESNRSSTIGLMENLDDLERALEELSPRLKRVGDGSTSKGLFIQPPPPSLFNNKSADSGSPRLGTRPVFVYPTSSRSESNPYGRQISPRIPSTSSMPTNQYVVEGDGPVDTSTVRESSYDNSNTPLASPQIDDSYTPRAVPRTPRTASYSTGSTSRPMTSHPSLDDTSSRMNFNDQSRSSRSSPQVQQDDSAFEPPLIPTPPPRSPALSAFRRSKKAEGKSKNLSVDEEKKEKNFFGKKLNGLFKKPDVSPDMSSTSPRFESPTLPSREFNQGQGSSSNSNTYFSPSSSTSSNPPDQFLFSNQISKELRPSKSMETLRRSPSNTGSNALPPLPTDQDEYVSPDLKTASIPNTPARPSRSRKPHFSQDIENLLTQMNEINNDSTLDPVGEDEDSSRVVPERSSAVDK